MWLALLCRVMCFPFCLTCPASAYGDLADLCCSYLCSLCCCPALQQHVLLFALSPAQLFRFPVPCSAVVQAVSHQLQCTAGCACLVVNCTLQQQCVPEERGVSCCCRPAIAHVLSYTQLGRVTQIVGARGYLKGASEVLLLSQLPLAQATACSGHCRCPLEGARC